MDDSISRQAAIDALRSMQTYKLFEGHDLLLIDQAAAMTEMMLLPPEDVQPVRHGVWMEENRRPRSAMFYCSECHRTAYDIQPTRDKTWEKRCRYAYCPNCGARMDGEQNDDPGKI